MDAISAVGLSAIQTGYSRATQDSQRAVEAFTPNSQEDAVRSFINLRQDALLVQAGAAIVKTGQELSATTMHLIA
jgi:hypothetical protein